MLQNPSPLPHTDSALAASEKRFSDEDTLPPPNMNDLITLEFYAQSLTSIASRVLRSQEKITDERRLKIALAFFKTGLNELEFARRPRLPVVLPDAQRSLPLLA